MFTKKAIRRISTIVLAFMLLLNIGLLVLLPSDADHSEEDLTFVKMVDNGSQFSTFMLNSRKVMDWSGDQLFMTYVKENETGALSAWLTRSPDGGDTWNTEFMIQNYTDCYAIKTDIHIHEDRLFLNLVVRNTTDWTTWSLHSFDVPVSQWDNASAYNIARLDDVYQGFMPVPHTLSFGDKVFTFWVRSHYMDTIYRIWDNGTWGPSMFLSSGTYFSNMAPIVSDVTGQETIHFIYSYYEDDRVYETTSRDGITWTSAKTLGTFSDSAVRISTVEHNGRLHIAVCEYTGYDIWYANSKDDTIWSSWQKIGEVKDHYGIKERMLENSVVMAVNDDDDAIYVGFDDKDDGIKIVSSTDNGTSFSVLASIEEENISAPALDPKGRFLLNYKNDIGLQLWEIGVSTSEEPDPGNETDPGDGNETDPGNGNETDPGKGNETDPGTGNETDPGDGNEPQPPEGEFNEAPLTPSFQYYPEGDSDKTVLTCYCIDPDNDPLNITWYIGESILGYGEEIEVDLPYGEYDVTVVVTDSKGASSEFTQTLILEEPPVSNDKSSGLLITGAIILIVVVLIFILITAGFFLRNRENRRGPRERGPDGEIPNREIQITGPEPSLYRPGITHVQGGILSAAPLMGEAGPSMRTSATPPLPISDPYIERLESDVLNDEVRDLHRSGRLMEKAREKYSEGKMSKDTYKAIERILKD